MYIRTTINSAGQKYFHLVESYRQGGKVKQRILLSLGRAEDGKLEELADALAKHLDLSTASGLLKQMSIESTYVLGPLLVLERLFDELGIRQALEEISRNHPQLRLSFERIVFTLVAARFLRPSSKLRVYESLAGRLYPEMVCHDMALQHIYRTVSLLAQHKDDIEKAMFWKNRTLLDYQVDVVLYDLTTLRFESTRTDLDELRRFGYSKEKRSDCTQVVLGLLLEPDGTPIGFEVYPGNTFEGATLVDIAEKLSRKFKVRRFIFVADRGLFSARNIETLKRTGAEFIVGMKLFAAAKKRPEFYDKSRFSRLHADDSVLFLDTMHEDDRCVITWTEARADRDRKVREDVLEKIREKLKKMRAKPKDFINNSNYHSYMSGFDQGKPHIDEAKVSEASRRDGFFALITNVRDKAPTELWAQYKKLWAIEDAFGELKGTLRARPVFHWTTERIIGHLTLCFLALACEARMTAALRQRATTRNSKAIDDNTIDARALTAAATLEELSEVRVAPVKLGRRTIWMRTEISGNALKLFQALQIKIPPRILRDEKDESVVSQNAKKAASN